MGIEAATTIHGLNATFPFGSDQKKEGDDHLRLIKQVLKNTFPGVSGRAWRVQSKSAEYTVVATDNMSIIVCTNAFTLALAQASVLGNGFRIGVFATNGQVVIDPHSAETIDGETTLTLDSGGAVDLVCDGSAFRSFAGAVIDGGFY